MLVMMIKKVTAKKLMKIETVKLEIIKEILTLKKFYQKYQVQWLKICLIHIMKTEKAQRVLMLVMIIVTVRLELVLVESILTLKIFYPKYQAPSYKIFSIQDLTQRNEEDIPSKYSPTSPKDDYNNLIIPEPPKGNWPVKITYQNKDSKHETLKKLFDIAGIDMNKSHEEHENYIDDKHQLLKHKVVSFTHYKHIYKINVFSPFLIIFLAILSIPDARVE